nr:MAG: DUF3048 domain-containing protein [Chloroflexota bacterium]
MPRFLVPVTLAVAGVLAACAAQPAAVPTPAPAVTAAPTAAPTAEPTAVPPTAAPTAEPTAVPPTATPPPTAVPNPTSDPITGAPALARGSVVERPYVVMIDNHPNAYPQTGMDKAAVVIEALAEFGLTRFMAVYAPGITPEAPQIGPVRSARLYFVQWAMGFGGLYAHAGGSPQALELAESTDAIVNVDALFRSYGIYFRRSSDRVAPHNLYTSSAELANAASSADVPFTRDDIGFLFKEDAPESARPPAQRINYFFLYREDDAGWEYDPATNSYLRLRRGRPARDAASGEQLRFKNIIVLEVHEAPIPGDDKGRIEQQVIGTGRARVFMDGVEREVTWRKDSAEGWLGIYDADGEEVRLNAGPVWIVALPSLENLSVS